MKVFEKATPLRVRVFRSGTSFVDCFMLLATTWAAAAVVFRRCENIIKMTSTAM
jgi:hypothetical protein